jgi:peptidoglycan/LPS O-acetylase OafA/YrhL
MKVTRVVNASIGVLTLVVSLAASLSRYRHEHAFGPALLLTSAIFGFVAVTLVVSWRRRPAPGTATMSAGLVWLVLLILTTVAIWDLVPSGQRPAFGFLLAVVVGVVLGAAAAPNVDLGPRDDDAA